MAGVTTYTCNKCRPIDTEIIEAYEILTNTSKLVSQQEAGRVTAENERVAAEEERTRVFNADHGTASDDHTTAQADHRTAGDDHTIAVADHGIASDDHITAVADHGTASDDHVASTSATDRANDAAAAAEHMVDIHQGPPGPEGKPAVLGNNGNWWTWDEDTEQYVDTGQRAQGPTGATPNFAIGTVSTGAAGSQAAATITGTTDNPLLNLTIPQGLKGDQGNTGSSVDYPYELVNNETTDDATKGATAASAKRLKDELSQLEAEVDKLNVEGDYIFDKSFNADGTMVDDDSGCAISPFIDVTGITTIYVKPGISKRFIGYTSGKVYDYDYSISGEGGVKTLRNNTAYIRVVFLVSDSTVYVSKTDADGDVIWRPFYTWSERVSNLEKMLDVPGFTMGKQATIPTYSITSGKNVRWDGGGLATSSSGETTSPIAVKRGDIISIGAYAPQSVALLSKCGSPFDEDNYTPLIHNPSTKYGEYSLVVDFDGYVIFSYRTNYSKSAYIKILSEGISYQFYKMAEENRLTRLKIVQFNEGLMNYGSSPRGLPDDSNFDTAIMTWRKLVSSFLADIYFANEHTENAKQGSTDAADKSATLIFDHFFPYSFGNTNSVYIFSKFPLENAVIYYTTAGERRTVEATITIGMTKVWLCCFHGVSGQTEELSAQRLADYTEIANRYKDYDYVILAGDTNSVDASELAPFVNNGFTLGNRGFFGDIATSGVGNPIDNIIVKGFNMDSFNVGAEKATSDHYPTDASVTALI